MKSPPPYPHKTAALVNDLTLQGLLSGKETHAVNCEIIQTINLDNEQQCCIRIPAVISKSELQNYTLPNVNKSPVCSPAPYQGDTVFGIWYKCILSRYILGYIPLKAFQKLIGLLGLTEQMFTSTPISKKHINKMISHCQR